MGSELRCKEDLQLFFRIKRSIASAKMDIGCVLVKGIAYALILI
jgi:hypothetical protein